MNKQSSPQIRADFLEYAMKSSFFHVVGSVVFAIATVGLGAAQATSQSVAYAYDRLGRLQSATYGDGTVIVYCYDWNGNRSQYTVSSTNGGCSTNHWPVAVADSISTWVNTAATFDPRVNDTDADGDTLTITAKTNGAHGSVAINSGTSLTYTPSTSYIGADNFTYTIDDGHGGTAVGAVSMTVRSGVTPDPVAWSDIDVYVASGTASGSNAAQTFTGINTTVTIKLVVVPGSDAATLKYSKNGGGFVTWTTGATLTVVAGDTLRFSATRTTYGSSIGTVQIVNQSDSNALLSQFIYDVESGT